MTTPAYLAGLLLAGRRVVVVGAGRVARRRVPTLLGAGADVTVIAPEVLPELADMAAAGRLTLVQREYRSGDLDGAWYVLALTDSAPVNADIAAAAEAGHTFCVRADRADGGSAWTPATGRADGVTIAAITAGHDPLRAKAIRDRILSVVVDEQL